MSATDESGEDEDEQFARIDMDALKQRGKGSYYCPLGHKCDKGGVNKDGDLVHFDRNSSFAYALPIGPSSLSRSIRHVHHPLTSNADNTATSIGNHGGATFLGVQIRLKNESLPAGTALRDTRPR